MDPYIARVATIQKGLETLMTEMKELNKLMAELKEVNGAVAAVEKAEAAAAPAAEVVPAAPKKVRGRPRKDASVDSVRAVRVPAAEDPNPKPKRVMTPEHLAKLKAGREAAKARKAAETAAQGLVDDAASTGSPKEHMD